ncbi:hypothetical protein Q8A73_007439 [Channa argus]|nr:hypothetical protein Q8A73_007439 [Channa argus]
MVGMFGTCGIRGLVPDTPPVLQCRVCVCVCACVCARNTGSIQSSRARQRSRLSSSDTFTQRQEPTCACPFHKDSDFTRGLICAHAPSPLPQPVQPRTCSYKDISPHFTSSHLTTPTTHLQTRTPSLFCWSQLKIPQQDRL